MGFGRVIPKAEGAAVPVDPAVKSTSVESKGRWMELYLSNLSRTEVHAFVDEWLDDVTNTGWENKS